MLENKENRTNTLQIEGMTCINCALSLERSLKKIGINEVQVNFGSKELIYHNDANISLYKIKKAIDSAGFSIAGKASPKFYEKLIPPFSFLVAFYFLAIMFIPFKAPAFIDLILAGLALIIGFTKFGKGAYYSLKSGSANMYVLILLGATTAFFFSIYLMLFQEHAHLYFETTAVLIALVIVGSIIEDNAIQKTLSSISKLAKNKVQLAKKKEGNDIVLTGINSIKIGDIIQANIGDEIHADALLRKGNALFDESLITGESESVRKEVGETILGGSILQEGNILYEVLKNPSNSTKARIQKLVQEAGTRKANVQKLADKIAAIFVPLIILLAILSLLLNLFILGVGMEAAILRSISLLVISCPCAMGLATPIAIMVGLEKMSEQGVLVKNPNAFENLAKSNQAIFDKTGTITTGKFIVSKLEVVSGDKEHYKSLISWMEQKSSHPIAKSIVKNWKNDHDLILKEIREVKGKGMEAIDKENNFYQFGSANFTNQDEELADLFLLKNKNLVAHLKISDEIKPRVEESIQYFKSKNLDCIVLSGDKQSKCDEIQSILGVSVIGGLQPEDKLSIIERLVDKTTFMLGDGINDAPALAKVNVGVSFADASNMAMHSSDVILIKDDWKLLETAHRISKMVYSTIQQNLFWAFSYNLVAIPLAAFGIINPMWAAFFMIFSDLVVVGNAFILKRKKIAS